MLNYDEIEELKNSIGEKSAQYIMMKLSKINKKYEDIKKGFYQKIDDMNEDMAENVKTMFDGLKGTIAGEIGTTYGLPPEQAEALAEPIVNGLAATITFKIPKVALPELDIPVLEEETTEDTTTPATTTE